MKTFSLKQFALSFCLVGLILSLPFLATSQTLLKVEGIGDPIINPVAVILPEFNFELIQDRISETYSDIRLGKLSNTNLIIKRRITEDRSMYEWFEECREGRITRKEVIVTFSDDTYRSQLPEIRYTFMDALPVVYKPATFNKNGIPIETLELQFNSFRVDW